MKVPFVDLRSQYLEIEKAVAGSFKRLIRRGDFILGRDVEEFEASFASYIGARHALGVNSGTDALFFALLSMGIGHGDEVILPVFTYIASAYAVSYTGAKPVFVDIDSQTFNIDTDKIEEAVTGKTKAIMPVHLYGQAAEMESVMRVAKKHRLKIIEDAAQAHGASYQMTDDRGQRTEKKVGSLGDVGCFSFYPTKNLGAFGDGGMVITNDKRLFEKLKKLRDYGRKSRYEHTSLGYNSRLDSIQALFLKEKLRKLEEWNDQRRAAALYYKKLLNDVTGVILPEDAVYGRHVYHIFAVRIKNRRDPILEGLNKAGISAIVHYPVPLHLQEVYKTLGYEKGDFPVAQSLSQEVLSLPIFPHIKKRQIEYVVKMLKGLLKNA